MLTEVLMKVKPSEASRIVVIPDKIESVSNREYLNTMKVKIIDPFGNLQPLTRNHLLIIRGEFLLDILKPITKGFYGNFQSYNKQEELLSILKI